MTALFIRLSMYILEWYIQKTIDNKKAREAYILLAESLRKEGIDISVRLNKSENQIKEIEDQWKIQK